MKYLLLLALGFGLFALTSRLFAAETLTPSEAQRRVQAGTAVLIDVREPAEWQDGVAAPAQLLSLSDLRGDRTKWKAVLEQAKGKELILYCRSGARAGQAAALLEKEGFKVVNAGGFAAWRDAGLPVRQP